MLAKCFVHKFQLQKNLTNSQEDEFSCQRVGSIHLGTRKPVVKIKVGPPSLQRVITLSDNIIQILNSGNLQFIPNIKLKNIITFAISNKSSQGASVDMCLSTKRNKLQLYLLDLTKINFIQELSVQESLISMSMDEYGILACSETKYFAYILDINNGRLSISSSQIIFTLHDSSIPSYCTNITSGEYLINGPNIGITTTLEGTSQRAPIMFTSQPNMFIYSHPYLIAVVNDYIHIYSYLDDQPKQNIHVGYCRTLINIPEENRNSILINTKDKIYLLESISIEKQIDQLLIKYRLDEALNLAKSTCSITEKQQTNSLIISTQKRIGFIQFSSLNVIQALDLFDAIHLDFYEIINYIADFLPLNSPWPNFDENNRSKYIQWLTAFCDYMIKRSTDFSLQPDYYSSILKAYLIIKSREMIIEFLEKNASHIPIDFNNLLFNAQLYHGVAILYSAHDKHEETIEIWKKIVLKEYPNDDDTFPGIWVIAKYILERNIDRSVEFSIAKWLLEQNEEELAIKIFIAKHKDESNDDIFCSDRVMSLLKPYPTALRNYLEQAAFKLMIETDDIHTTLVNIYLDQLLSKSPQDDEHIRAKLQEFLIKSNSYRIQSVLHRINQTDRLKREVALLYGKMNNFEQAFEILVNELEDFEYAVNYCIALSYEKSSEDRKIVAHILFKVLLACIDKHPDEITQVLLRLLCNNEIEFNFLEVLKRLPSHWSISLLADILLRAVRSYSYTERSTKLELALSRLQNEKLNIKLAKLKCSNVIVNEYRRCKHCLHQFYETSCVVYPDGSQVHIHCAKQLN
ncbi:unnamed protein product [Adineta steineri]|uniref:CNH domain-containing protein n=1 Tax=Adineta steineri TaxID=433720 RepID=A0A814RP60_9BILA|nr:unnamed protein product [Adineta steineri]CAF3674888.1 unnamed protein product [Adineta steineri]CAF3723327.1 unnamed protein product [Adineta steineri]